MPTPSVPDGFYRYSQEVTCNASSHVCVVTWNGLNPGAGANDLATALRGVWLDNFAPGDLDDDWTIGPGNVLINVGGSLMAGSDPSTDVGTSDRNSIPIGQCVILRKRTGFVGRAFRGRFFVPGGYLSEALVDEAGVIDATRADGFTDQGNALLDGLHALEADMWLVSADLTRETLVNSMDAAPKVHWLRRRMR
jgi:hypothetical protein